MPIDDIGSATIRRLIFKAKLRSGQVFDLARTVADLAVKEGFLKATPDFANQHPLDEKIVAVFWGLIIEGIYSPGSSVQHPNLPSFRVTDHGLKCFEAGELAAHDPDDYINRLRVACPSIDEITLLYLGEALDTFRAGNFLASTVMIGVASENMLRGLVDAVGAALNTPTRQGKFKKDTEGKKAKAQHDQVLARLASPATRLPIQLNDVFTQHIDGIFDLIRRSRNDAGHPTGRRMERYEVQALLLLFPTYCGTVCALIAWLASHKKTYREVTRIGKGEAGQKPGWAKRDGHLLERRFSAPRATPTGAVGGSPRGYVAGFKKPECRDRHWLFHRPRACVAAHVALARPVDRGSPSDRLEPPEDVRFSAEEGSAAQ